MSNSKSVNSRGITNKIDEREATAIIKHYGNGIISAGKYVNASELWAALSHQVADLNRMQSFRNIQALNKAIDSAVDVYWHSYSIRIYSDLKAYVTKSLSIYFKKSNAEFENFGVGYLCRNERVVNYFQFYDDAPEKDYLTPPVDVKFVLVTAKSFMERNRNIDVSNQMAQERFDDMLRANMGITDPNRKIGVRVEFKDLYHKLKPILYSEGREVRSYIDNQSLEFRNRLNEASNALRDSLVCKKSSERVDVVKQLLQRDRIADYSSVFSFIVKEMGGAMSSQFDDQFWTLYKTSCQFNCISPIPRVAPSADGTVILQRVPLLDAASLRGMLEYRHGKNVFIVGFQNGIKESKFKHLIGCGLAFIAMLCTEVCDADKFAEDVDGCIRAALKGKLTTDVPEFALQCVIELVRACALSINVDTTTIVRNKKVPTVDLNLSTSQSYFKSLRRSQKCSLQNSSSNNEMVVEGAPVEAAVKSSKKKSRSSAIDEVNMDCISVSHYVALLCSAILFYRMSVLDLPEVPHSKTSINKLLLSEMNGVLAEAKGTLSTVTFLARLEHKIVSRLQVPAFECLKLGPFLCCLQDLPDFANLMEAAATHFTPAAGDAKDASSSVPEGDTSNPVDNDLLIEVIHQVLESYISDAEQTDNLVVLLELVEQQVLDRFNAASFQNISGGKTFLNFFRSVLLESDVGSLYQSFIAHVSAPPQQQQQQQQQEESSMEPQLSCKTPLSDSLRAVYECAVKQFVAGNLSERTILTVSAARYLCNAFGLRMYEALEFCEIIVAKLSECGQLPLLIDDKEQTNSFDGLSVILSSPLVVGDEYEVVPRDLRKIAKDKILLVPVGFSCFTHINWIEEFHGRIDGGENLVEFVVSISNELQTSRPDVTYFFIGRDDFIPLPKVVPNSQEFFSALVDKEYQMIGAWLLGAVVGLIDKSTMGSILKWSLENFFDNCNNSTASVDLIDICLMLTLSMPASNSCARHSLLLMLCDALTLVLHTSQSVVESHMFSRVLLLKKDSFVSLEQIATRQKSVFETLRSLFSSYRAEAPSTIAAPIVPNSRLFPLVEMTEVVEGASDKLSEIVIDDSLVQQPFKTTGIDGSVEAKVSNDQKAIICSFLSTEFDYSPSGERPLKDSPQGKNLQNALDMLSKSLYTSEVHFVMELLQNADDNYYEDVQPCLKFQLKKDALYVYNNEVGFKPADIYSICKVGGSTKLDRLDTHIGQKGIGFKSVFSVSDFPEIHSNGFHIRFNRDVSMLEPVWIDESAVYKWPCCEEVDVDGATTTYATCLRLQFDTKTLKTFDALRQRLEEVMDETLMLFLNKLQVLMLEDASLSLTKAVTKVVVSREKISESWISVSLQYVDHPLQRKPFRKSYWLTKRDIFKPNNKRIDLTVASTEVALAFKFLKKMAPTEHDYDDEITDAEKQYENHKIKTSDLQLDIPSTLMPVYAFLPTKSRYFKFILQANFVLATNRESVMENDWNQELLNRVPKLFVEVVKDMLSWIQLSRKSASMSQDCPLFSELQEQGFNVSLSTQDILDLLPRKSLAGGDKRIKKLVDEIYAELKTLPFLESQSGDFYCPSELLMTADNDFANLIKADVLLHSTGLRYIHSSLIIDEELEVSIGLKKVDQDVVVQCLRKLSDPDVATVATNNSSLKLSNIAACLVVLGKMCGAGCNANSTNVSSNRVSIALKPSQVQSHRVLNNTSVKNIAISKSLPTQAIRELAIWPVSPSATDPLRYVSLNSTVIMVGSKGTLSPELAESLELFTDRLLFLSDTLFVAADKVMSGGKGVVQFLIDRHFKSISTGQFGFQDLTPDVVVNTVILPEYKKQHDNVEDSVPLDRHTAAAFLAFFYLATVKKKYVFASDKGFDTHLKVLPSKIKQAGIIVPTLCAKTRNKYPIVWEVAGNRTLTTVVDGNPDGAGEVHLGMEFSKSSTKVLCNLPVGSALRQLNWTIVDPLVAALIFRLPLPKESSSKNQVGYLLDTEVTVVFKTCPQNEMVMWEEFQRAIGVVDFFGIYNNSGSIESPTLFEFLNHLLKGGTAVSTDNSINNCEDTIVDLAEEEVDDSMTKDEVYLPVFQPTPSLKTTPLIVSRDVFEVMLGVVTLVTNAVSDAIKSDASITLDATFVRTLREFVWFPIHLVSELISHPTKLFILAAPVNVFHCSATQDIRNYNMQQSQTQNVPTYPFGPHIFYAANTTTECDRIFQLRVYHNEPNLHGYLLLKQFEWMARQRNATIISDIPYMRQMYVSIYKYMEMHPTEAFTNAIKKIFIKDAPFLWFPDNLNHEDRQAQGKFYPLSKVFESDPTPTKSFHAISSDIKNLSYFYGENRKFVEIFARPSCCNVCKSVEGMFGVKGLPRGTSFGSLHCTCLDKGFGKFVEIGGLVRKGPNLGDIITLLRHYSVSCVRDESDDVLIVKSLREKRREEALTEVKSTLESISREVWKCFHLKYCLHPYSSDNLELLKAVFSREQLLPAIDSSAFVSLEASLNSIAVDDQIAFELFHEELKNLGTVQWIDAKILKLDYFSIATDAAADRRIYDIMSFKQSKELFLQLPVHEFTAAANTLPPETFFAPQNMLPLLEFLEVPKLTRFLSIKWNMKEIPTHSSIVLTFLNKFLCVAQTVLWCRLDHSEGLIQALTNTGRVQKLLKVNVISCSSITRNCHLALESISCERSHTVTHHMDIANNVLYVDQKIDKSIASDLCILLVMSAVRFELAKLVLNQNVDLMKELQNVLAKITTYEYDEIISYLGVEYERKQFPASLTPWLVSKDVTTPLTRKMEDDDHDKARQSFDQLMSDSENSKTFPVSKAEKDVSADQQQQKTKETEEKNKIFHAAVKKVLVSGADIDQLPEGEGGKIDIFNIDSSKVVRNDRNGKLKNDNNALHEKIVGPFDELLADFQKVPRTGDLIAIDSFSSELDHTKEAATVQEGIQTSFYFASTPNNDHHHATGNSKELNVHRNSPPHGAKSVDRLDHHSDENHHHYPMSKISPSLLKVDLSELHIDIAAAVDSKQLEVQSLGDSQSEDASGRIGELAAKTILQKALEGQHSSIQWVNEDEESGKPYDYVITMNDGTQKLCEVKTRTSETAVNQWFISPSEIQCAEDRGDGYFILLLWYKVVHSDNGPKFVVQEATIVGLPTGLSDSIRSKQSKLIIQVNLR